MATPRPKQEPASTRDGLQGRPALIESQRIRPSHLAAIPLGVSLALVGALFVFLPVAELLTVVGKVPVHVWFLALGCYLGTHVLGAMKWWLLIGLSNTDLPLKHVLRCYFAGLFGNLFLPGLVGGDVVSIAMAVRVTRTKAGVILGTVMHRTSDVIALLIFAGTGLILLPTNLAVEFTPLAWRLGLLFALLGVSSLALVAAIPPRRLPFKLRRHLVGLRRVLRSVSRRPKSMLVALALAVVTQGLLVALISWTVGASGLELDFTTWLGVWPLAKLSASLPVTQGGIGAREVALVVLLRPFGQSAVDAAAAGLIWDALVVCGGVVGGGLSFMLGRFTRRSLNG